jgi:hyperosmotically inducible protein
MSARNAFSFVGFSLLLLAIPLTACDKPRTAERAGQRIDRAAEQAEAKVGNAAEKVGDAAGKVADKLGEEGAKAGAAIDDTEVTTKVKGAIFAEPGLRTLQISVDTLGGVVTLTGSVDSRASRDRAGALAAAIAGVKRVENRLAVKGR